MIDMKKKKKIQIDGKFMFAYINKQMSYTLPSVRAPRASQTFRLNGGKRTAWRYVIAQVTIRGPQWADDARSEDLTVCKLRKYI